MERRDPRRRKGKRGGEGWDRIRENNGGDGAGRYPQQSTGPPEAAAGLSEAQASPGNHSSKTHGPCAQES